MISDDLWELYRAPLIKRRGSVICGPRKRARTNGVSILAGTGKSQFSHIRSSVMPYPNSTKFTVELASTQGGHISI